jgi:hypothetical protein
MANRKLSQLTEKASLPLDSLIHIVDPNDLSDSPQGSDFKFKVNKLVQISFVTYSTYALMIEASTPTMVTMARVLVDENKGIENSEYRIYTDGTRMWIANTIDN